jgi:hypothetical protein
MKYPIQIICVDGYVMTTEIEFFSDIQHIVGGCVAIARSFGQDDSYLLCNEDAIMQDLPCNALFPNYYGSLVLILSSDLNDLQYSYLHSSSDDDDL